LIPCIQLDELFEPTTKTDDVIALVIDGSAYYDVERDEENWIRVQVAKGDLIVIPAGVTHRFTTTPQV
jgi:1,2-dihydroxy-3-keto-5-methylthiopentene dioxygenase